MPSAFFVEVGIEQRLCQDDGHFLAAIAVVGLHSNVVYLRPYTERGIAGQCHGVVVHARK